MEILENIRQFIKERQWGEYHTPRNLAISISVEAAELLEIYQWSDQPDESEAEHIKEEIADVLIYSYMLADKLGLDIETIIREKIAKNAEKYPLEP